LHLALSAYSSLFHLNTNLSMKKIFTNVAAVLTLAFVVSNLSAQRVVWPIATDTVTVRASQFADTTTIRRVPKVDSALTASNNAFRGWLSVSINQTFGTATTQTPHDSTNWTWTSDGTGRTGSLWGTRTAVNSSDISRGRGAAIFNSNFLDASGISGSPHKGELWSPIIDATGINDMTLVFNQYYRHFASTVGTIDCWASTAVSYSNDGGATWSPLICLEEIEGFGTFEEL
jgi:hypothetical protein